MTEMLHTIMATPPIMTNTHLISLSCNIDHLLPINTNHVTIAINFIATCPKAVGHSAQVPMVGLYPIAPERVSKVYWP